jgi:eukaryotic-like serine/threonine-protein kinase
MMMNLRLFQNIVFAIVSATFIADQPAMAKDLRARRLTANTPELAVQAAALSPDGKFIAYADPLGIHVRAFANGETRSLAGTEGYLLLRWTSDGSGLVARVQDTGGTVNTVVVSAEGGTPTPASPAQQSVLSPDGKQIAVISENPPSLSVQDATGANKSELWKGAAESSLNQFQWSPNGTQIAVLSTKDDEASIELFDVATGKKQILSTGNKKLSFGSVVWPQPNRLILSIDEDLGINQNDSNLWEAKLDGNGVLIAGGLRQLTFWTDCPVRTGSLATDGKRLLFIRSFHQRDVYVAPLEAGGAHMGTPRRLTLDLGDDYPSGWTADSKTVILTSGRNGPQGIFRQGLDEQTAHPLVTMPGDQLLARNGYKDSLLFLNYDPAKDEHSQLMRVSARGGTAELVPNAARVGYNYRCSAAGPCLIAQKQQNGQFAISELDIEKGKGREIYRDTHVDHLFLSPDGKWIADTAGSGAGTKIVLRSFATGKVEREIPIRGVTKLVSFDYASDGKGFFVGDQTLTEDRELFVDELGNSSLLWSQPGTASGIWGVPSPDGKYLALVLTPDDANVYVVDEF